MSFVSTSYAVVAPFIKSHDPRGYWTRQLHETLSVQTYIMLIVLFYKFVLCHQTN